MNNLTEYDLWDKDYIHKKEHIKNSDLKIDKKDYSNYILWDILFSKFLKVDKEKKVLEVGSAPGTNLLQFYEQFGYIPFGIEYTKTGASINRNLFKANGISSENVIEDDFFSENIKKYNTMFDVVSSFGFVEHFDDVNSVINKHLQLLKKDGILIIVIPNLRGFYYYWTKFFNPVVLTHHNLKIMEKGTFKTLFERDDLEEYYCDYFGVFHYGLMTNNKSKLGNVIISIMYRIQLGLNKVFRVLFKKKGFESKMFSPFLVYIGKKTK